ncbi:S9 family peptidase [Psychromicrobium xiongbiense]|uniref:S9 family peptidase n=1 Tax=Psychromicrobium xiongbiense TaxID=3051184 RepID=UPI002554A19E|nr:S9 family peptidase [Psychromicrobium sp. YIM S02556]
MSSVSAPTLHPAGDRLVYANSRADFGSDSYVGQLWEARTDGATPPRRITRGRSDSAPRYAPDGTLLAFLRPVDGKAQLHVLDARGGESTQVTDAPLGVADFDWSPDSKLLAYTAAVPEDGRYGTVTGVGAEAEAPRLLSTPVYRLNGAGYTQDKPVQIFLVEVPDPGAEPFVAPTGRGIPAGDSATDDGAPTALPKAQQLTEEAARHGSPRFSADGRSLLYTVDTFAGIDLRTHLFRRELATDTAEEIVTATLSVSQAVESLDGQWLFALAVDLGESVRDFIGGQTGIYVRPVAQAEASRESDARGSEWTRLTGEDQDFTESPRLVPFGIDSVLTAERIRGAQWLRQVSRAGEQATLVDGPGVVTGMDAVGSLVALSYVAVNAPGEIAVLHSGAVHPLTGYGAELARNMTVAALQEVTVAAPDGYPVHGWLLVPEGEGPHPVLLNIHGGPFSQYGWGFFDEAQVYVEAGYAVLICNPRGSSGYGRAHARAIKGTMGTVDLVDVLAFVDQTLASHPELDADRLGIMGGSYGGYLTAWAISQDHRFTAAIVERGYLDPASFVGSSDIGWFFTDEYVGTDPAAIAAQSPMAQIDSVRTPTFVIHSEQDLRCPVEQGQRYFAELIRRDVPAQLLLFPGENHELSRAGRPLHRKERFDAILDWWARYLPTEANPRRD